MSDQDPRIKEVIERWDAAATQLGETYQTILDLLTQIIEAEKAARDKLAERIKAA
jgi:chorismate mutase